MTVRPLAILAAGAILAALAAATRPAPVGAQTWRPLGPAPITDRQWTGRVAALAVSGEKKNRYWAGAASGGVWQSNNGGGRWRARTDPLATLAIGAIALDPSNERVIYAGSGEANYAYHSLYGLGLYKSTHRGRRWRVLAADTFAGRTFSRLVVSPADGDVVWAAVARAGGTREGNEGARRHPDRDGRMGIFRSTDGGESWRRLQRGVPGIPASDVDLDPENPDRVYASFGQVFGHPKNGIYRSTDGGDRWTRLAIGLAGGEIGRISLAVAPSDADRIYALVARPATGANTGGFAPTLAGTRALLRSDDGGDTWTALDPGNPQSCCGQYYSAIAVHPVDPDIVFVGGLNLLRSTDGGASYRDVTPPHVDLHDLAFDADGRLVAATDGGVHRSDDLGDTWVNRNQGLGTVQFYPGFALHPSEREVVLGGTQDNGTNLRLDASGTWVHIAGGDGGWSLIHPQNPNVLFVQFQGAGNLFRSADGGLSFARVSAGISPGDRTAFQAPVLFDPADPEHMFYATERVYESTDGGSSWSPVSAALARSPWAIRSLAVAPSDPSLLWAATSDGAVHLSSDRGRTFRRVFDGLGGWPRIMRQIAVDPEDASTAFLADLRFGGGRVWRTTDRGASWESLAGDLPDRPVASVAVAPEEDRRHLFAATDAGVWHSDDEGASWRAYGRGLPNAPAMDVLVDGERGRLVVSTLGRGMWEAPLP